jgi:hypothetical protein
MSQFEKKMKELFGDHSTKEIEELILDEVWVNKESFTEDEKTVLEKYTSLIHLSLNNIGFKSLKNFPTIKGLYVLSLNKNELNGDDFDLIKKLYPNLNKLKVCENNIEKIENLAKLRNLPLRKIEVKGNPFSVGNNKYKNKLYDIIPTLKVIDHENREGDSVESTDYHNEHEEEEDDGDYCEEDENVKNIKYNKDDEDYEDEENEEEDEDEDDEK